jgi:rod shape-determining protein MreC
VAAPTLAERRPEIFLAVLLSLCLVTLSLQVRRPGGRTVGEGWLLTAVSPFVDLVTSVRSGVHEVGTWAMSRHALRVENRALTAEVVRLRGELLRLRDAEEDKGRLLELFGAQPSPPPGTIPARLIAVESSGPFHTALLDRGASDGLQFDGVVLARGGLLGRVIALGPRTARVQLLSDNTAAVGVLLTHATRGGRVAVAKGDGKGSVSIEYVPTIEPVEPNDTLVSSGTDGLYPGGLPVGRVASVRRNKTLFWEIQVSAAADPNRESLVFVLPPVRKSDVTSGPSVTERR